MVDLTKIKEAYVALQIELQLLFDLEEKRKTDIDALNEHYKTFTIDTKDLSTILEFGMDTLFKIVLSQYLTSPYRWRLHSVWQSVNNLLEMLFGARQHITNSVDNWREKYKINVLGKTELETANKILELYEYNYKQIEVVDEIFDDDEYLRLLTDKINDENNDKTYKYSISRFSINYIIKTKSLLELLLKGQKRKGNNGRDGKAKRRRFKEPLPTISEIPLSAEQGLTTTQSLDTNFKFDMGPETLKTSLQQILAKPFEFTVLDEASELFSRSTKFWKLKRNLDKHEKKFLETEKTLFAITEADFELEIKYNKELKEWRDLKSEFRKMQKDVIDFIIFEDKDTDGEVIPKLRIKIEEIITDITLEYDDNNNIRIKHDATKQILNTLDRHFIHNDLDHILLIFTTVMTIRSIVVNPFATVMTTGLTYYYSTENRKEPEEREEVKTKKTDSWGSYIYDTLINNIPKPLIVGARTVVAGLLFLILVTFVGFGALEKAAQNSWVASWMYTPLSWFGVKAFRDGVITQLNDYAYGFFTNSFITLAVKTALTTVFSTPMAIKYMEKNKDNPFAWYFKDAFSILAPIAFVEVVLVWAFKGLHDGATVSDTTDFKIELKRYNYTEAYSRHPSQTSRRLNLDINTYFELQDDGFLRERYISNDDLVALREEAGYRVPLSAEQIFALNSDVNLTQAEVTKIFGNKITPHQMALIGLGTNQLAFLKNIEDGRGSGRIGVPTIYIPEKSLHTFEKIQYDPETILTPEAIAVFAAATGTMFLYRGVTLILNSTKTGSVLTFFKGVAVLLSGPGTGYLWFTNSIGGGALLLGQGIAYLVDRFWTPGATRLTSGRTVNVIRVKMNGKTLLEVLVTLLEDDRFTASTFNFNIKRRSSNFEDLNLKDINIEIDNEAIFDWTKTTVSGEYITPCKLVNTPTGVDGSTQKYMYNEEPYYYINERKSIKATRYITDEINIANYFEHHNKIRDKALKKDETTKRNILYTTLLEDVLTEFPKLEERELFTSYERVNGFVKLNFDQSSLSETNLVEKFERLVNDNVVIYVIKRLRLLRRYVFGEGPERKGIFLLYNINTLSYDVYVKQGSIETSE